MTIRYAECITCGLPGDECQCPALGQVAGTPPMASEAKRRALLYDRLSMAQPEDIDEVLAEAGFVLVKVGAIDKSFMNGVKHGVRSQSSRCAEIARGSQCPSTVSAYTWRTAAEHIAAAIEGDT